MSAFEPRIAAMPAADLVEMDALADLRTRIDRKYVVSAEVAEELVGLLHGDVAALEIGGARSFSYTSVYFDTPDLLLYREAATARRRRFKVRTRVYGDADQAMLEVKTRGGRGRTMKVRIPQTSTDRLRLSAEDRSFVDGAASRPEITEALQPTLTTNYVRSTLLDRVSGTRTTLDQGVTCTDWRGESVHLESVVLETKSAGGASETDRLLWRRGLRPIRISKFCTALAALHPDLPSNRWRRTLRRHF